MKRKSIVVLISGNGSNLQAIIDAVKCGEINADISLVVSNKADAYGLDRAANAGIRTLVISYQTFKKQGKSRIEYELEMARKIKDVVDPDIMVLAGFMLILSENFIQQFKNIINLHPALPGQFDGTHAIERAFTAFTNGEIKSTGVMVHRVIPEVDRGPVILKQTVDILPTDTIESLEERIHAIEHQLIVKAINKELNE
jgi:phosphoribosylglycinamide formyltransferase